MTDSIDSLVVNKNGWDRLAGRYRNATHLPSYGPLAPTEDELTLLPPISDARILEIGCGCGQSLEWLGSRGAAELWGLDLSARQVALAQDRLSGSRQPVRLFESPMERNPGIPTGYFDLVFSIYALGWTNDLPRTLMHVTDYLRPGGRLVFSWEHPAYGGLEYECGKYYAARSFEIEGPQHHEHWSGVPMVLYRRTLGTFVNALLGAGLIIERLVERSDTRSPDVTQLDPARYYAVERATLVPTTFVLKARKPR